MSERQPDRRRRARWAALAAAGTFLVLSAGLTAASGTAPPQHIHVGPDIPPGEKPEVQRWFKSREDAVIELNNAVQAARDLTTPSGRSTAACVRLSVAAWQFQFNARSPETKLDAPASAGRTQFAGAARACLAGDFAAMRRQIDEGAAVRADAQHHVDEMLHGEE